jgi:hypothetical protein
LPFVVFYSLITTNTTISSKTKAPALWARAS